MNILFLGYSRHETDLIHHLEQTGHCVEWSDRPIASASGSDWVVSYGYRHIISKEVIDKTPGRIINLHISYLPWNKGAHPNFWAHYDDTPSGVTIHLVTPSVDSGPIFAQKRVSFVPEQVTFEQSHRILRSEIEALFMHHSEDIFLGRLKPAPQTGRGSTHKKKDLPTAFGGWHEVIGPEIARLRALTNQ